MSLSIPRVKPLGWVDDELLTAAQATQLDLNISLLDGEIGADEALANHQALRRWTRAIPDRTASELWTQVVGMQPIRSFDTTGSRQRMPLLLGANSGVRLIVAISADGTAPETPRSINTTTAHTPTAAAACQPGEAITIDGSNSNYQYTTDHGFSFTVVLPSVPGAAAHYVANSGQYLYLASNGNFSRGTTIASGFPTAIALGFTAADPLVSEFADDGAQNVVLVSRVSSHGFASIYNSTDGGLTWVFVQNLGGFNGNVAYSKARSLFYAWSDDGTLWTSPTGAAWTLINSTMTVGHGFQAGAKTLACVGPAVVKAWRYVVSTHFTQRGIAYSLDGGATWNSYAFGEVTPGGASITQVRAIDNHLYAVDDIGIWASGPLVSPLAEF